MFILPLAQNFIFNSRTISFCAIFLSYFMFYIISAIMISIFLFQYRNK